MDFLNVLGGIGQSAPQVFQNVNTLAGIQTERDKLDLAKETAANAKTESEARLALEDRKVVVDETRDIREAAAAKIIQEQAAIQLAGQKIAHEEMQENKRPQFLREKVLEMFPKGTVTGKQTEDFVTNIINTVAPAYEKNLGKFSNETFTKAKKLAKEDVVYLAELSISDLTKKQESLKAKIEDMQKKGDPAKRREFETELKMVDKQLVGLENIYPSLMEQKKRVEEEKNKEAERVSTDQKLAYAAQLGGPNSPAWKAWDDKKKADLAEKAAGRDAERNKAMPAVIAELRKQFTEQVVNLGSSNFYKFETDLYKKGDREEGFKSDKEILAMFKSDPTYKEIGFNNEKELLPLFRAMKTLVAIPPGDERTKAMSNPAIVTALFSPAQRKLIESEAEKIKTYAMGGQGVPAQPGNIPTVPEQPKFNVAFPSANGKLLTGNALTEDKIVGFLKQPGINNVLIAEYRKGLPVIDREKLDNVLTKMSQPPKGKAENTIDKNKYPLLNRTDYSDMVSNNKGRSALSTSPVPPEWISKVRAANPGKTDEQISLEFLDKYK